MNNRKIKYLFIIFLLVCVVFFTFILFQFKHKDYKVGYNDSYCAGEFKTSGNYYFVGSGVEASILCIINSSNGIKITNVEFLDKYTIQINIEPKLSEDRASVLVAMPIRVMRGIGNVLIISNDGTKYESKNLLERY